MGAVGQPRAGDSSLLLVTEEPDKQGQMKRFSYKVFTEPKPRFLNCDIMPYLVRTVSSRFQPIYSSFLLFHQQDCAPIQISGKGYPLL